MPLTLTLTEGVLPKGQEKVAYSATSQSHAQMARP